jgi:hypothetical protein
LEFRLFRQFDDNPDDNPANFSVLATQPGCRVSLRLGHPSSQENRRIRAFMYASEFRGMDWRKLLEPGLEKKWPDEVRVEAL